MVKKRSISRFDIFSISLDPTKGSEIQKTRPCLIISPDEMNRNIRTVIIAPMTSASRDYPTRVNLTFQNKSGQIVLDQIRTVDQLRLIKKLGRASSSTQKEVLQTLQKLFAQ